MRYALVVALGGAAGTLARWYVAQRLAGPSFDFPWNTFTINVAGSFVLGMLIVLLPLDRAPLARAALGVGFCGGFTTFSTFSAETVALMERGLAGRAAAYVAGSIVAGVLGALAGMALARTLTTAGSAR